MVFISPRVLSLTAHHRSTKYQTAVVHVTGLVHQWPQTAKAFLTEILLSHGIKGGSKVVQQSDVENPTRPPAIFYCTLQHGRTVVGFFLGNRFQEYS
jgi:hypothetical protein